MKESVEVEFQIAKDAAAKKAGEVQTVKMMVSLVGVTEEELISEAIKARIVSWQSNIRSHWQEFVANPPTEVRLLDVPYSSTTAGIRSLKEALAACSTDVERIEVMRQFGLC